MKNTNKKGFTIVELVIVIAVIAILSAVLIPTFGSIIESANKAVDTQLVAQINTILVIEDVLGGGVNDAVEIQKVIKENGLKLETKTKGQYIWYDIENKKAVLAGLNETGIAVDSNESTPTASSNGNGPVLLSATVAESDDSEITEVPKGYYKAPTSPENFVEGYLFLSTESADGLADAIHALRNPNGDNEANVEKSLTDALAKLDSLKTKVAGAAKVAELMQDFMSKTAILTKHGTIFVGTNTELVTKILVSSSTDILTANALSGLATTYPQLYVIDLHSDVIDIEDVSKVVEAGDIDAETGKVNGIYFVYCNEEIKEKDKDPAYDGNIKNLITVDERNQYITQLVVVRVYLDKDGNPVVDENGKRVQDPTGFAYEYPTESHKVVYDFPHLTYNTEDKAYEFKIYSFDMSGNPGIAVGTENYFLTEDEQLKINGGVLTLYAIFEEVDADFKIGSLCYSSAQVTSMLADNTLLPEGTTTITVVSTTATLGDETNKEITIPSGVTLHLPYYTVTDGSKEYSSNLAEKNSASMNSTNPGNNINKLGITGHTNLTIAEGVTLNNNGIIYVDAVLYGASGNPDQCYIRDDCGVLQLANGSTLNTTGAIYAYGIIRGVDASGNGVNGVGAEGEGKIIATAGTITEIFTVLDWFGGTNAYQCVTNKISPFHNWTVDNIRANMSIYHGVNYTAFGSVYVQQQNKIDFTLVGSEVTNNTETNPLFKTTSGAIIRKTYDDGFNLDILAGTVEDCTKSVKIEMLGMDVTSVSANFNETALPLPNFDLNIKSGAKLVLNNNLYKVLPGSDVVVENGGELVINTQVAFYDTYDLKMISGAIDKGAVRYNADFNPSYILDMSKWSELVNITKDTITDVKYNEKTLEIKYDYGKFSWGKFPTQSSPEATISIPSYAITYFETLNPASLTVNGTLTFGATAKFTGKVESSAASLDEGATIKIDANAKFTNTTTVEDKTVHAFKEGFAFATKSSMSLSPWWQPTYADVATTGNFRVDLDFSQIPTGAATYTYNGSVWAVPTE